MLDQFSLILLAVTVFGSTFGSLLYVFLGPRMRKVEALQDRMMQTTLRCAAMLGQDIEGERKKAIKDRNYQSFSWLIAPYQKRLEHFLYRSGFKKRSKIFLLGFLLLFLVSYESLQTFMNIQPVQGAIFSFVDSLIIMGGLLKWFERGWKKKFLEQFPTALDAIIRALKAGLSIEHGIALTAKEIEDPVGSEFRYISAQLNVGFSPERAFTEASARVDINDFRFFCIGLLIQKEIGGNLSVVLRRLATLIRERQNFRKKVLSLSAEGRTSSIIVTALPIIMAASIEFLNPGYFNFFLEDPNGRTMLWIAVGLVISGSYITRRIAQIKGP